MGCEAPTIDPPAAIFINAPVAGTVSVRGQITRISSTKTSTIDRIGDGPYTVTLSYAGGQVTIVDAPGPLIDFGAVVSAPPVLLGPPVAVHVIPNPREGAQAVLVAGDQVILPEEDAEGFVFSAAGNREAEVVVLWSTDGRARTMARRKILDPRAFTEIEVRPTVSLEGAPLPVVSGDGRSAWVTAELTVGGRRSGLLLAEGRIGRGASLAIPRGDAPGFEGHGLWVTAAEGRPGLQRPVAEVSAHVEWRAEIVSIDWPSAPDLSPQPRRSTPSFLSAIDPRVSWGPQTQQGTYLELELIGYDGCRAVPHRYILPADPGEIDLPRSVDDPLAAPLVSATVRLSRLGLSYAELFGEPHDPSALPRRIGGASMASFDGWWRVGEVACAVDERAGWWTLARPPGTCVPGQVADRVRIDRCGTVVDIDAGFLRCGRLEGARIVGDEGGALEIAEEGEALLIVRSGDDWRLRPAGAPGISVPAALIGAWGRVEVTEAVHTYVDGVLGAPIEPPFTLAAGGGAAGPFTVIDAVGRVELVLDTLVIRATITQFDGRGGIMDASMDCADGPSALVFRLDGAAIEIEQIVPTVDAQTARVLTYRLTR